MIVAVILAAGTSSRLGRPKQLLQLGNQTVIEHVVDRVMASCVDRTVVVVGHAEDEIRRVLTSRDVDIVVNPLFREGQSTSLLAGVAHAKQLFASDPIGPNAIVMMLVDQPSTQTFVINRVVAEWQRARPPVALAMYGTHRSHPVVFDERVLPELLEVTGDEGARQVLRRYGELVVEIDSGETNLPPDIDTEEAYRLMVRQWADQEPKAP